MKDLVIIGGGPGGYVAAIRARQLGMNVSLIEKDSLGGTCLNRGCIPTKAYFKNAEIMHTMKRLSEYNISTNGESSFDMAGAKNRKDEIVKNLVSGVDALLKGNGVEIIKGEAFIKNANTILVNEEEINTRRILIATGSNCAHLPIEGMDLPGVLDSDKLLDITEIPSRLAIIGGGVIGMEFACIFNAFGSEVTVYEYAPSILSTIDKEIVKRMNVFVKKQGIKINAGVQVEKIEKSEKGLKVRGKGKKGDIESDADMILVSAGRVPCITGLNLDEIGIEMNGKFIKVDENFSTNVQGIYAIGDVIGGQMLAHLASEEGIVAVERMAGIDSTVHYHAIPGCIFTFPEIASVGMSQEEASGKNINCKIGKFQFAANGKAMTMGEINGMVKVIADEEDRIIGVHIIGPHASDLILEAVLMVKEKLKVSEVIGTIHPHPTLGEALYEAILDINGEAIHILPRK